MFLEALEILQSAGEDVNTYVTDFALYKVVSILTTYCPLMIATFLMSQEFLGRYPLMIVTFLMSQEFLGRYPHMIATFLLSQEFLGRNKHSEIQYRSKKTFNDDVFQQSTNRYHGGNK